MTPLGRPQKYPKVHVSTGEKSSGSGTDSTQDFLLSFTMEFSEATTRSDFITALKANGKATILLYFNIFVLKPDVKAINVSG